MHLSLEISALLMTFFMTAQVSGAYQTNSLCTVILLYVRDAATVASFLVAPILACRAASESGQGLNLAGHFFAVWIAVLCRLVSFQSLQTY